MTATRRALHVFALVLALALPLLVVPGAGASGMVYEAPRNISANGQTDVTDQLLAFFARVPDGSTISFPAGARYNIEGTLYLYGRRNLTFEGNGAEFFATTDGSGAAPPSERTGQWVQSNNWPRHRAQWIFDRSTGITLRNMAIKGANPNAGPWNGAYVSALEAQHGVEMAGSSGIIEGVSISDTYGDLISVSRWSTGVVIRQNYLTRSGRQGVTVDGATDVAILRNVITDTGRSIFDLEPPTPKREVRRVWIVGNQVGRANGIFVASLGKGVVNDITVQGNVLTGLELTTQVRDGQKNPDGTQTSRRANWSFINNVSDKPFGSPMAMLRFWRVDGVTVRGNVAPIVTTQGRKAVETWESCGIVAEPNTWQAHTPVGKLLQPLIALTTDGYETTAACTG